MHEAGMEKTARGSLKTGRAPEIDACPVDQELVNAKRRGREGCDMAGWARYRCAESEFVAISPLSFRLFLSHLNALIQTS